MNWRTFGQATVKEGERFFLFVEGHIFFAFIEENLIFVFESHGDSVSETHRIVRSPLNIFLKSYPDALWAHIHLPESHNEANP